MGFVAKGKGGKKTGVPKPLASNERATKDAIQSGVAGAIDSLKAGLDQPAVVAAIKSGRADRVISSLNWSIFISRMGRAAEKIGTVVAQTAKAGVGLPVHVSQKLSFDLTDPRAVHYAQMRAGDLLTSVTDQQKVLVKSIIVSAVRDGVNPEQTIGSLSRVIGLNDRQAVALENAYQKTIALHLKNGATMGLATQRAQDMAKGYRIRLIEQRAEMVARTEVMYAQNAGRLLGFQDAVDQGLVAQDSMKQWSVSGLSNTCDECAGLDGETVALDDTFSNGEDNAPAHPNCECTILLVPASEAA